MAQKITQNYATKGNGILEIDENKNLLIYIEGVEDPVNLANLLAKYDGCEVKFSFNYDETYALPEIQVDESTGEII
jgi:hypothetical protein